MINLITSNDLATFAAAESTPPETEIVAQEDKFLVRVTIKNRVCTVGAIIKGKTIHERKFPTISAATAFLFKTNIRQFKIDARFSAPRTNVRAPANQKRMLEVHRSAKHTEWLRKEVEASRSDPRPSISHDVANKMFDANLERLRALHESMTTRVVARKKASEA